MDDIFVRSDDVFALFQEVIGGADIDDIYDQYSHLNLNFQQDRKYIIDHCIKAAWLSFDQSTANNIKHSLAYFANTKSELIYEKSAGYLFPFEFPIDTKKFLFEIWEALFDEELSSDSIKNNVKFVE